MESPEAIQAELARRLLLGEIIARNARKFPDKEAVIYGDTRLTFRQFNARINRLAHALMDIGIKKGEHILGLQISVYDIAPTLLHLYGIPVPSQMKGRVLKEIFEDSKVAAK